MPRVISGSTVSSASKIKGSKKSIYIAHRRETANALNASVRCEQKRLQGLSETVSANIRILQAVRQGRIGFTIAVVDSACRLLSSRPTIADVIGVVRHRCVITADVSMSLQVICLPIYLLVDVGFTSPCCLLSSTLCFKRPVTSLICCTIFCRNNHSVCIQLLCPRPVVEAGALGGHRRLSSVRLSV